MLSVNRPPACPCTPRSARLSPNPVAAPPSPAVRSPRPPPHLLATAAIGMLPSIRRSITCPTSAPLALRHAVRLAVCTLPSSAFELTYYLATLRDHVAIMQRYTQVTDCREATLTDGCLTAPKVR